MSPIGSRSANLGDERHIFLKINYFLNGQGTGHIHLDPAFGMVITSEALLLLEGKMEIKVPYLAAQAMPVTIKTKVLLEQL